MKMNDKKSIDRLFQEKFKDFEVTPNEAVWKKIKAQKDDDRKRILILPFWYRIAGAAALIAILFSIGSIFVSDDTKEDAIVVIDEIENVNKNSLEIKEKKISPPDAIVTTSKRQKSQSEDNITESTNTNNEAVATNNSIKDKAPDNNTLDINSDQEETLAYENNSLDTHQDSKENITSIPLDKRNEADEKLNFLKDKNIAILNTRSEITNNIDDSIERTTVTPKNKNNTFIIPKTDSSHPKKAITKLNSQTDIEENSIPEETSNESLKHKKKSIFDAVKEKESTEIAATETEKIKRWNIAPNVAPVYYDTFGNGSSIDQKFADNTKQGQVNLSYGVQVAYNINKKLSVRSGINKVDLGYNTEDVGFGISSIGRSTIDNESNNTSNVQNIIVSDFNSVSTSTTPSDINDGILVKSQNPGLLNHSIGYFEVPLELTYALTENKLGVHMIGGISTLFLDNEEVSIIAGNFKNDNVQRDQTVNNISFSGNIGLGLDYKLSDQFQINMEPIFKYQFNGFKENVENFKPYYFGVYTGISFRF